MEAAAVAATVVAGTVAKEANLVAITKVATAEVAVAAMEAVVEVATIKVDMVEAVAAMEVAAAMVVAAEAATEVVDLRRENSKRHGAVAAEATEEVAVAATEEAIVVAEDMVEETKTVEVAVEEDTPILKEVAGEEIPEGPSILRIIMKATRMEVAQVMEVEEVVETNSTEMETLRGHLESSNSTLAARERCRSKILRVPSSSISVSTLRRTKVFFRPKRVSLSLLNAGRG
jgi:hypothetical protein